MCEYLHFQSICLWYSYISSCETVALRKKNLLTDQRATIRSVLKVVYFLRTIWGIFLHFHTQSAPNQGIKKFLCHFPSTLVPSLLTKFDFPLSCDQTSRFRILQMIGEKLWHVKRCNIRSFPFVLYNSPFVLYNFPFVLYNFSFVLYNFLFVFYIFHLYCIFSICIV
jgi:hypothetical protein